jgi:hypothetical protein
VAEIVAAGRSKPDERVAAARLTMSRGKVARWENATRGKQRLEALKGDEFFGYGVDAGTGCFMDARTAAALGKLEAAEHKKDNFEGWLMARVQAELLPAGRSWGAASVVVDGAEGANVVCFSSGWGDGVYASFFGLDARGEPVCLVTDFGVLP